MKGEINLDVAKNTVTIDGLAEKCYGEDLIGTFLNEEAIKFPEKIQGQWSSCDAERCPSVEFTIASKSVSVAGTGFEDCISDSATLEQITVDGPVITVKHSGMTSSGWELNVNVVNDEEIKIGGAETFAGTYKKGSQDCPSRTIKPYDYGSDDDDDDDDYGLGSLGCAADCLAEQVECQEDCGDTDFSCITRCATDGLSCQEDC